MKRSVSPWARERFGERAAHVLSALVDALHRALADAQDAHKVAKSKKLFTFGAAQASRRYECIVEALKDLDGAQVIKPKGSPHELVVLDGNLIYPFRYAKGDNVPIQRARVTDRKVSGLISELFACYGPEPEQPSLFDQPGDGSETPERSPVLTTLPEGTRLVLLAYASNDRAGILNAWLGEGELGNRGHVRWLRGRYEQLPLASPISGAAVAHGSIPAPRLTGLVGGVAAGPRFDDGVMPAVPLTARAPVERENSDKFPPVTERAPETPKADEQNR
ncbi:hypothetical protein ACGFI9_31300 [Micromonospora sp. NPDC048930]|uniref:hypothetical protein n=1 Tax=Micromonospora sp. NPDC048930 TaxID=3364261 RepID=UPI003721EEE4